MPQATGLLQEVEGWLTGSPPGQSKPPQVAPGAAELSKLHAAGFSADAIAKYQQQTTQKLLAAGFSPQQVDAHWGEQEPHSDSIASVVTNNVRRFIHATGGAISDAKQAFEAGWGTSVTGLTHTITSGGDPNKAFHAQVHAGVINSVAETAGQLLGDLPAGVAGFFGGATAGAGVGAAVPIGGETGVTEELGGAFGAGFGMTAAPQAVREALVDGYNHDQIKSFSDALHVIGSSTMRTAKAGVVGGIFNIVGGPVASKLAESGAPAIVAKTGGAAAAVTAGVTTGAALDGHVPDQKDFLSAAVTVVALHGVGRAGAVVHGIFRPSAETLTAQHNFEEIYRRSGVPPWEAVKRAQNDPGIRQETRQQDVNGSSVTPRLHESAPPEPPPVVPPGEGQPAVSDNFVSPTISKSGKYAHEVTSDTAKNTSVYSEYRAVPGAEPIKVGLLVNKETGKTTVNIDTAKIEDAQHVANTHGPTVMRDILNEVLQAHPEVTEVEGIRKTGAGGKQEITQGISAQQVARLRARMAGRQPTNGAAPVATNTGDLITALEGSRDDSVSPAGAIGKHQVMLGTARQYGFGNGMSQTELAQWLHNPDNNAEVFHKIMGDLQARFHGNVNAILIAYNAGPGRAGEYLTKGPGTMLEAIPDRTARGGIRYESVPADRDESWLPMETQKYLANGRRRSGGASQEASAGGAGGSEGGGSRALTVFPDENNHAYEDEEAAGGGSGLGGPPALPPAGEGGEGGSGGPGSHYTPEEAVDEIMANIGEPPKPPSLIDPDRLMQQYVSELAPARSIDNGLVKAGDLNRNRQVGQEDMFRQTYASDTRTGAFVRYGILRIRNNEIAIEKNSPSVMLATDEVRKAGGDMRGWTAWMLARRTLDKEKQGIKTGFNRDAAEALASDRAAAAKYEKATETFNRVMDGGLEYGRDSGLFSQAQIDAMMKDNPAYISMRRVMGDDESFAPGRGGKFQSRDPLRMMEGSDRQIVDPIYATIDNLRVLVAMADRNRAIGSIIGQVEMGKLEGLGLKKEGEEKASDSTALVPYGVNNDSGAYDPLLAERAQGGLKPNEFIYYRNGVPERWTAKDPALVRLMKTAVSRGEANLIGKIFDRIASLDRMGIVTDPSFPTRITLRHQVTAFIADPLHPPPFITWMRGIIPALTENNHFQEWLANGGAGTALTDMDVNWLQRDMERVFEDQGIFNRMWNRMKSPLESYQWMAERMDAAARIGYYKRALDKGIDPLKAATMSRKAYLDYAERASLQAVNSIARKVPFLRPRILGMKQFAEAFMSASPSGKAGLSAATTLGIALTTVTLPSLALYAANYLHDKSLPDGHDDEKYDAIPRWIRDTHYITPPIAGTRIQFPYPPVIGVPFGGMINRFLDSWLKEDPHAFDEWARSIVEDYDPRNLMPTAIKAPVEATANYNFFSGHPVVPASVQAADGYMQYTNATTEPAKAISRYLGSPGLNIANFSPIQFEHWVDGWTGPVGMGVLKAVNGRMTDYKPPHQMADTPVVGTFFVRNPGMHAQQIEDFYTDLKAMEAAHADWSLALKHGNEGEMAEAARGPFFGLRVVGKIAAALKVQSAAISAVNTDQTLRPEEKSQAVDQILNSMIQMSIMGSGIVATLQHKEPSKAFKEMDKSNQMSDTLSAASNLSQGT